MRNPSKALIKQAQAQANESGKEVAIGLPIFADQRQSLCLFTPTRGKHILKKDLRGDTGYCISMVIEPEQWQTKPAPGQQA